MPLPWLLLAAQGAGIGAQLWGNSMANDEEDDAMAEQSRLRGIGAKIEQDEINLRMEQEELASSEENLFSLERIREVLATQNAIFGARGQATGVGTAGTITNKSISNYSQDKKAKNLSKSFRKFQLENQIKLSKLNQDIGMEKQESYKRQRHSKQISSLLNTGLNMFSQGNFGL